jgi:transcriptional regulator with XRE-family HTH domain
MATIPTTALGALIREKRQSQGLSLDALGRLVGVHRSNIIKHEQGERFPKRVLPAYVEALGITRDELVTATGLTEDALDDLGVTFPETELAVPVATPFFTREQIHPGWHQPIDLTALGA